MASFLALELTLFGGLAKVLTAQRTEDGVSKGLATHSLLKMRYLKQELKIYIDQVVEDEEGHDMVVMKRYPIIILDEAGQPLGIHGIAWRETIWNSAVYRSLEIWKKLPKDKLENSLGKLTSFAKKSLNGKLGANNKNYLKKDGQNNWVFIAFKQTIHDKAFQPFSEKAIIECRKRAKAK